MWLFGFLVSAFSALILSFVVNIHVLDFLIVKVIELNFLPHIYYKGKATENTMSPKAFWFY